MDTICHSIVKLVHRRIAIVTVRVEDIPRVPEAERVIVASLAEGFYRIKVRYGFKDEPDIPKALELCAAQGIVFDVMETSFFLGREKLFIAMFRNAGSAAGFFKLPPNRVVEMGTQVVL